MDVCNGYSVDKFNGANVYIRHLSHKEHLFLDEIHDKCYEDARINGAQPEKDRVKLLVEKGVWSEKKEDEITRTRHYIKQLNEGKKNVNLISVLESHNRLIAEETKKLNALEYERIGLVGMTCEAYANKVVNDYYIVRSVFKDRDYRDPLLSEQEFDEIDDDLLSLLVKVYRDASDICSELNLKKLSIQDFYTPYFYLCNDDIPSFYGKAICDLTYNQVKLANFSKYFKQLLDGVNTASIPKKVMEDPDELISFLTAQKNGQNLVNKNQHTNVAIVGGKKEDLAIIGGAQQNMPKKNMSMRELQELQNKNG